MSRNYQAQIYCPESKTKQYVQVTENFKELLNILNEKFNLPIRFKLCYCDSRNVIQYIACQGDYLLFIKKAQENSYYQQIKCTITLPLLQIVKLRDTKFVSKEQIKESEEMQEQLSEVFSQISSDKSEILQVQEQFQQLQIQPIEQINEKEENNYHKCQLCYKQLPDNLYYRCTTCFYFQICIDCNLNKRFDNHIDSHLFILCKNIDQWEVLKQNARDILFKQKNGMKFRIHQKSIHEFITCDKCNIGPIQGIRYKCIECPDFDLCLKCISLTGHIKNHNFVQLTTSLEFIKFV